MQYSRSGYMQRFPRAGVQSYLMFQQYSPPEQAQPASVSHLPPVDYPSAAGFLQPKKWYVKEKTPSPSV